MTEEKMKELERLSKLHDSGVLTDEEFNLEKQKVLNSNEADKAVAINSAIKNNGLSVEQSFSMTYRDCFDALQLAEIVEKIKSSDEQKCSKLKLIDIKNPSTVFWISLFFGALGADRFMLNQTGMGFLKLLVGWCSCGIWYLGDLFTAKKRTREYNYNQVMSVLD